MLITLCESPLSVVMTAGDVGKWRDTPDAEKRLLLGRRLAQVHDFDAPQATLERGGGGGSQGAGYGTSVMAFVPIIKCFCVSPLPCCPVSWNGRWGREGKGCLVG